MTTHGIVTAVAFNGFYIQDPADGFFVFTSDAPSVEVGQLIEATCGVSEFVPGGADTGEKIKSLVARFTPDDGDTLDLLTLNMPMVFMNHPSDFAGFFRAITPDPGTGKLDPEIFKAFFDANPESQCFLDHMGTVPVHASYAESPYYEIHRIAKTRKWRRSIGGLVRESMMEIFADPITVNCRKVIAGLKMIGANYSLTKIDYFEGEQKSPEFMTINPNASLPAMRDGFLVLWESNAILQYAADQAGNAKVYPTDLKARADVNRWLLWECGSWFPTCYIYLVENCVKPLLGAETDQLVLDAEAENFHKLAGILNSRLGKMPYVAGNHASIADVAVAAPMHLHGWAKLPLDNHPNIMRWMTERIETAPWWKATQVDEGFTIPDAA